MARRRTDDAVTAAELGRVFGAEPEGFTAARDALARELAAARRPGAAAAVKALRRPALPVWVLNRLARDEPRRMAALLEAGRDLAAAQAAALSGRGAEALRGATDRERAGVADLAREAARLLAGRNRPEEPTLQRVRRMLHALPTATEEEREQVRAGVLDHELEPAPFGSLLGATSAGAGAPRRPAPVRATVAPAPAAPAKPTAADRKRARARLQEARAALREADQEARRDERERVRAAAAADAAAGRVAAAERELAAARAASEEASARAESAARRAAEAHERAGAARQQLTALEDGAGST